MIGRIDVHSHLLPNVDDGCGSLEESLECARILSAAGYTHAFCTPHIWPNLPNNTIAAITRWTALFQEELHRREIPLRVLPGGELNLHEELQNLPPEQIVSFAMNRRFVLLDLWGKELPSFFAPTIRWLQSLGLQVILAHPERMRAVQDDPSLAETIINMGVLLQGNLHCLSDPPQTYTRRTAELFLREGRYFLLGSDTHKLATLPERINGLRHAIQMVGDETVDQLTIHNPRQLLP